MRTHTGDTMFKTPGQVAFESYVTKTQGASVVGVSLPSWEDLTQEKKDQWEAGAITAVEFHKNVKEKFRERKGG